MSEIATEINANPTNDASAAGKPAGPEFFPHHQTRFAVQAIHTRRDAVSWFVSDYDGEEDVCGLPPVVGQHDTMQEALDQVRGKMRPHPLVKESVPHIASLAQLKINIDEGVGDIVQGSSVDRALDWLMSTWDEIEAILNEKVAI